MKAAITRCFKVTTHADRIWRSDLKSSELSYETYTPKQTDGGDHRPDTPLHGRGQFKPITLSNEQYNIELGDLGAADLSTKGGCVTLSPVGLRSTYGRRGTVGPFAEHCTDGHAYHTES